jgi:polysaccharide export outer membrane protein
MTSRGAVLLLSIVLSAPAAAQAPPSAAAGESPSHDYVIATDDVLNVTVWDHADLSGKFTVQPDGGIILPLVGPIAAAGQTVAAFERTLTRALADGWIREPRVYVTLDRVRGRRIFVFGGVAAPGTYVLADSESLIQVLARAGYGAASEAIIVRPKQGTASPTLPEAAGDADVIRVSLKDLEKDVEHGSLARNVVLQDGDTIFVPRSDVRRIFVTGKVRTPGAYSIAEGTTVLQALTLAGGPTEEAAVNRLRIVRLVDGKQVTIRPRLTDPVQPGDTIVVPERFF